ncbi:MAG TPA: N-acetylmuramoyl-L-alanine amidase [Solimonas sp.]
MRGVRWVALLFALPLVAAAAELRDLRLWDGPESTRIVFDLGDAVSHKVFTLPSPDRVVIDIDGLDARSVDRVNAVMGKGAVRRVRGGPRPSGIRVVLDVAQPVVARSFSLTPTEEYGHRLVVDVQEPRPAAPPAQPSAAVMVPPSTSRLQDKPIVIAVDAGHGGEDPGARGSSGLLEKDVALSLARKLARSINAQPGMRAVLTRDGDYYVGLRERVNIARKHQADLFVSVHCNAFTQRSMRGTSVYVLSNRGASSEHARWLAQKENAADLVGGVDLHDKDHELAAVLIDLSQSATLEASLDVGGRILRSMGKVNVLQKADVQQAGFAVLKAPDIPSVLVETAFISNAHEEKLLADDAHQDKFVSTMLDGIKGYFHSYRPKLQVVEAETRLQKVSNETGRDVAQAQGVSQ